MDFSEPQAALPGGIRADAPRADANRVDARKVDPVAEYHVERRAARRILAAAPEGRDVLAIARYFAGLRDANWRDYRYNEEWPASYASNPVIDEFLGLQSRSNDPNAVTDATYWCAAFVNWCLARSGRVGTGSAESRSFRALARPDPRPAPGDIAVFADVSADRQLLPTGHVAFWLGQQGDTLSLLGAVQRFNGTPRIAEAPVPRVRIDPRGRIERTLLGTVSLAAMQQLG